METTGVIALQARSRTRAASRIVVSSHVEVARHTDRIADRYLRVMGLA
jgi:hypothetical protein